MGGAQDPLARRRWVNHRDDANERREAPRLHKVRVGRRASASTSSLASFDGLDRPSPTTQSPKQFSVHPKRQLGPSKTSGGNLGGLQQDRSRAETIEDPQNAQRSPPFVL